MSGIKPKLIAVDTQPASLRELEAKLSSIYHVLGTSMIDRALPLLRNERDVAAIIVATAKGADVIGVLETARQERPKTLRILLTDFENLTAIIEGLHTGAIQRVVSRPIEYAELLGVIRSYSDAGAVSRTA